MPATLTLDLPWLPDQPVDLAEVEIERGPVNRLSYDDGIELAVALLAADPEDSVRSILRQVDELGGPGKVVLVVGSVPVEWRSKLRKQGVSWLATDGRMELRWPRLSVSAHRLSVSAPTPARKRSPVALQKRQGVVAQVLCELALSESLPVTVSQLAGMAEVDVAVASSAAETLARHGFVSKQREGNTVLIGVDDVSSLARLLADRTGWEHAKVVWAHGFGRSPLDVAHRVTRAAKDSGTSVAVTGRVGATYLGIVGTGEPSTVRVRVEATPDDAAVALEQLGLEAVDREAANVAVALDRWRLGTTSAQVHRFQRYSALIAPPVRVWCDLDGEPRGTEFAAHLWEMMRHG
jgi:hypothetical protein